MGYTPADTRPECLPDPIAPPRTIDKSLELPFSLAEKVTQNQQNQVELEGNVEIQYPQLILNADKITLYKQTETAQAFGEVKLYQKEMVLTGQRSTINNLSSTAYLEQSKFQFTANNSHGAAHSIFVDKRDRRATLDDATFTTCRLDELKWQARDLSIQTTDKYDWQLDFDLLEIDDAQRRIYGDHVVLSFYKVPVFYSPKISFPMDQRATGLLFPVIGSYKPITRDVSETYLSVPLYINIAPEVDDTVTFLKMQDRGLVFGNELRYLQPKHSATLTTHWLRDQITSEEGIAYLDTSGEVQYTDPVHERWDAHLLARQSWAPGLTSDINWREVSDENFYADVPVNTTLDTSTNVERNANIRYNYEDFSARLTAQDYLRLRRNAPYNYEKRPELSLNYVHYIDQTSLKGIGTDILAEATDFEISYSATHNKPEGVRSYISPAINYTVTKLYGGIKAEIVPNKVHYHLRDNGYNTSGQPEHDITVPQYALKGNLIFEKSLSFNEQNLIQTLEPQLQYLYVPYQDQSNIPVFDTTDQSLDFSNLFSYNRFSGYDRIGDTNQISAALTTRILKNDGTPIADAGIGQIFYLADRKVSLNKLPLTNESKYTAGVSDYFVKAGITTKLLTVATTTQFSYLDYELTNANSRLKIDVSPKFVFLLTNTLKNAELTSKQEDLAAGFNWKMNDNWTFGTYWNYDFTQDRKSEASSALRYDSCCWASELSVKEEQLGNGLYNYSVQYVIEFKGLSSVGTPFNQYLKNKLNF